MMPTSPALCAPGCPQLLPYTLGPAPNSAGCPDVRDQGLGELPVQTTLMAHSHHFSKGQ